MTIHQPNSLITAKFDDFMLLAAGRVVYQGAWEHAVDFFARMGWVVVDWLVLGGWCWVGCPGCQACHWMGWVALG